MGHAQLLGVVTELLVAVVLVGAGAATGLGRARDGRAGPVWALLWGAAPTRTESVALVGLGLGVGVWAVSQAQERAMGQAVVGLVVVLAAGLTLTATALARPEAEEDLSRAAAP